MVSERLIGSNRSLWYAFGPQGETRQLTDSAGNVADTYLYSPYGVPMGATGTDANPFRYGGQVGYYTPATNPTKIILCGARWYSPDLGRWLSRDPIGYAGGANMYEYCDGSPINATDPEGTGPGGVVIKVVVRLIPGRAMRIHREISMLEAQVLRRKGRNVVVTGQRKRSCERVAKQIEDAVPGTTKREKAHAGNPGGLPHYQTEGIHGHTFIKVVPSLAIPFAHLGEACGLPAWVDDVLNPISDIEGLINLNVQVANYLNELQWQIRSRLPADPIYDPKPHFGHQIIP